jgi:hypothetical protein
MAGGVEMRSTGNERERHCSKHDLVVIDGCPVCALNDGLDWNRRAAVARKKLEAELAEARALLNTERSLVLAAAQSAVQIFSDGDTYEPRHVMDYFREELALRRRRLEAGKK